MALWGLTTRPRIENSCWANCKIFDDRSFQWFVNDDYDDGEQTLSLKYYLVFHIIGTILGKVYLDGNPANQFTGMQAVLVGPAQGAIMEFVLPEKGKYTFVDHSFASATMGATGVLAAD